NARVSTWATRDELRLSRAPTSTTSSVANVMMPKPPTWTNPTMTTWPNGDQYVAVSTVTSPVTHTADTLVNAASRTVARCPVLVAEGSDSSSVPTNAASANAAGT